MQSTERHLDYHPYRAPDTHDGINELIREARKTIFPWDTDLSTRVCAALAAERDRANRAEARLAQILEYAESTYTASTVARRIVQMGKATA